MPTNVYSTLYTVSGIMFSIGMCLIVTSNTNGVLNKKVKNKIRSSILVLRDNTIACFFIATILFILSSILSIPNIEVWIISLKIKHVMTLYNIYAIIYFIYNFILLQKLNYEIEDEVNK